MEGKVDRISGLPEGILHHILSFLLAKDVIRAAATCKRLNNIWTTLPYLDLGHSFFPLLPPPVSNTPASEEAMEEVDAMDVDAEDEEAEVDGADEDEDEDDGDGEVGDGDGDGEVDDEDEDAEADAEQDEEKEIVIWEASESEEEEEEDYESIVIKREKLFTFVEQTLSRRRMQDLTIHKFRLGITTLDAEISQNLDRWIGYLVHCNIKDLNLRATHENPQLQDRYYNLPSILLTARSLYALTLSRCRIPCGSIINLQSLCKLRLEWAYLEEQTLKDVINTCRNLEHLHIAYCPGLSKMEVSGSSNLKVLTFIPDTSVDDKEVLIEAQYLQRLSYSGGWGPIRVNIITNFEGCLTSLRLLGANITHTWFRDLMSRLVCLEELWLSKLNLKSIEISSSSLKRLVISNLFHTHKGDITVHAPNLLYLQFEGGLTYRFTVSLAVKEVFLVLYDVKSVRPAGNLCSKLMQFLSIFDHSKVVKLRSTFFETMIFPEEKRANLLAPLAHIEHLILQGRFRTYPLCSLEKLLHSLLWISPNIVSLSLKDVQFWNDDKLVFFPVNVSMKIPAGKWDCSTISRRCLRDCRLHGKMEFDVPVAGDAAGAGAEVGKYLSHFFTPDVQVQLNC